MYANDSSFIAFCQSLRINTNRSAPGNKFQAVIRYGESPEPALHVIAEKVSHVGLLFDFM